MVNSKQLERSLRSLNGKSYKAYNDIKGSYDFGKFTLYVDHIQSDPFASPSKMRVRVSQKYSRMPEDIYSNESREIGVRNFLAKEFHRAIKENEKKTKGSGKSGDLQIDNIGQEMLERTCVFVNRNFIEVRFFVGLPAFGRKIAGNEAVKILCDQLPKVVENSLLFARYLQKKKEEAWEWVKLNEDAEFLRNSLEERGLIAFVGNGAILPRRSGINPKPLEKSKAVAFESPESLEVEFNLPNKGKVKGMGIKKGINLVIGGGYHGKSTLLNALELGVYNHVPGDGREFVISNSSGVKIRAEDGRSIEKVDISPFIKNLPFGKETKDFSSENASGSTSQAANIMESIEAGAEALFIDEDTSATNFMIRDQRMQELVNKDQEPITPFIDKTVQLYKDYGVSTILVIGGSGDYFDVAGCVICMENYRPYDYTGKAKEIAEKHKSKRQNEGGKNFGDFRKRKPKNKSIDASKGNKVKIKPKGLKNINFGVENIDLHSVEQLVDLSQTRAIGDAIFYAKRYMKNEKTIKEIVDQVSEDIKEKGLDVINPSLQGDFAGFRKFELAQAINRLRILEVSQIE
ncbi:MAG: ABC-ATPase domain-containing protein [Candidatus Pacearchaeota archaeon]